MDMDCTSTGLGIFDQPQCLIESNALGQIELRRDVIEEVKHLDKPVVVVAIAGKYRTGKSFLMNRLHGQNKGFSLGSTIQSHTKGIWIWAREHPTRKDCYVLLLDTEGLADPKKGDEKHDATIFCLALLLSSVLCYNSMGVIDDDSLQKLNFITELSKHVRLSEGSPQGSDEDLDLFFPHFVYVLRDFMLDLEMGGKPITEDEYLESCLKLKDPNERGAAEFNLPRGCLRKYFPNRHCFTLDRPVDDPRDLRHLDDLPDDTLGEDFLEQAARFCDYIFSHAPVKYLPNGQPLRNGSMWASMAESFVQSIQNGRVPCIESAVVTMATLENTRALDSAVEQYMTLMTETVMLPTKTDQDLADLHQLCMNECTAQFVKRVFCDEDHRYKNMLHEKLCIIYEDLVTNNQAVSREVSLDHLVRLEKPFARKLRNNAYRCQGGYSQYQQDLNSVIGLYETAENLGIKKTDVSTEYMLDKWLEADPILKADQEITEQNRQQEMARLKSECARKRQEAEHSARERVQHQAAQRQHDLTQMMEHANAQFQQEKHKLKQHQDQILQKRLSEQRNLLQEGFNQRAAPLRNQLAQLRH